MSIVDEGFSLITPRVFEQGGRKVPEAPGVYAILLRGADRVLHAASYQEAGRCEPWRVTEYTHLYTGESFNLSGRLRDHLFGEPADSGFQLTLLALQHAHASLWRPGDYETGTLIADRLQSLLRKDALIAFKRTEFCGDVEEDIIRRSGSPLNITGRRADKFTRLLRHLRQTLRRDGFDHLFEARKTSSAFRRVAQASPAPHV